MDNDQYTKSDITRLKNLLRDYRDHMITNAINKNWSVECAIRKVDNAIYTLKSLL